MWKSNRWPEKEAELRTVSEVVDKTIDDEEEEVAQEFLTHWIKFAQDLKGGAATTHSATGNNNEEAAGLASIKEQSAALQLNFQNVTNKLAEEIAKLSPSVSKHELNPVITPISGTSPPTQPPEFIIHREYKVNGQIGERGQKDKLSYWWD